MATTFRSLGKSNCQVSIVEKGILAHRFVGEIYEPLRQSC